MNEENYASDSDQSDEDFCPEKLKHCVDSVSEDDEEEEEEQEDVDSEALSDAEEPKITKRIKKTKNKEEKKNTDNGKNALAQKRSTRVQTRTGPNVSQTSCLEKDNIESDDEEKVRTDSLWSSFLSDVKPTNSAKSNKTESTTRNSGKIIKVTELPAKKPIFETNVKAEEINSKVNEETEKSVEQNKSLNADEKPSTLKNSSNLQFDKTCKTPLGIKRSPAAGGLGSILGSIEKKKKVSVLEKSKLDWNSYKQDEGLDEELQTHNKGKDGYLERMDFLQRTDLRQFEIEKKLRVSRRSK